MSSYELLKPEGMCEGENCSCTSVWSHQYWFDTSDRVRVNTKNLCPHCSDTLADSKNSLDRKLIDPPFMSDVERTLREEKWVLAPELFTGKQQEAPLIQAFKQLNHTAWEEFVSDLTDNEALRFFNTETGEFSHAKDWEDLAASQGIEPFDLWWMIDQDLSPDVQDVCREIRAAVRAEGCTGTGGQQSFMYPTGTFTAVSKVALVVNHDGGALAPFFNLSYERPQCYNAVDSALGARNMWREMQDCATTYIYERRRRLPRASA